MSNACVRVVLSDDEWTYAAHAGVNRMIRAIQKQRVPRQPGLKYHQQHWWQSHIIGCIGEMAVAKALGVDWADTENDPGGYDVLNYQVRSTEKPQPELVVRTRDNPNDTFILCRVYNNKALIYGFATGLDVRQRGWPKYEAGTFMLNSHELNEMAYLIHPVIYTGQVTSYNDE